MNSNKSYAINRLRWVFTTEGRASLLHVLDTVLLIVLGFLVVLFIHPTSQSVLFPLVSNMSKTTLITLSVFFAMILLSLPLLKRTLIAFIFTPIVFKSTLIYSLFDFNRVYSSRHRTISAILNSAQYLYFILIAIIYFVSHSASTLLTLFVLGVIARIVTGAALALTIDVPTELAVDHKNIASSVLNWVLSSVFYFAGAISTIIGVIAYIIVMHWLSVPVAIVTAAILGGLAFIGTIAALIVVSTNDIKHMVSYVRGAISKAVEEDGNEIADTDSDKEADDEEDN